MKNICTFTLAIHEEVHRRYEDYHPPTSATPGYWAKDHELVASGKYEVTQ